MGRPGRRKCKRVKVTRPLDLFYVRGGKILGYSPTPFSLPTTRRGRVERRKICGKQIVKGKHGSGNKDNFESGQNKTKACSYILEDRECSPLIVTMDTSC